MRLKNRQNVFWTARLILLVCLAYAIFRYNVFGSVSWSHIPLFVFNKALSMASTIVLLLATFSTSNKKNAVKNGQKSILNKGLVSIAYLFTFLHILISLLLVDPAYYPKFYLADGLYTFSTELALLSGVAGFYFFSILLLSKSPNIKKILFVTTHPWVYKTSFIGTVIILLMVHCLLIGASSWICPNSWPGYMPPISLISFIMLSITLFRLIINKN